MDLENIPRIIMGTMNIGVQVDARQADRMLAMFLDRGFREIDTAHRYADGLSEDILGRLLTPARRAKVYLATKAHPQGGGGLGPERITKQVTTSLKRLGTDCVDLLYLHAPDPKTPIDLTLEAIQRLYRDGKFRELGLSNYASWQVADIWHLCRGNGGITPSVYQGRYSAMTRDVEAELIPVIRHFGIRFNAYNPLAGGLLTGKYHRIDDVPQEGRFALKSSYLERFWKPSIFDALEVIRSASAQAKLSMTEAALQWLVSHSLLKGGSDGVILAASNLNQWETNLAALRGELPGPMVEAFHQAWGVARCDCPCYFRE